MLHANRRALLAWAAGLACQVASAATGNADAVEVVFADRSQGTTTPAEARQSKDRLTEYLQELGKALPAGQHLKVVFVRLELAGRLVMSRGEVDRVRVLDGRADGPRIELHYVLTSAGGVVAQGDDVLSDMAYLERPLPRDADAAFPYEKRLLATWFRDRFRGGTAPSP